MAHIHPHGWRELAADAASGYETVSLALQRELATLSKFAETLPDSITIYHGVHWTHLSGPHTVVDDIDFVLIAPSGKILLIEQASGFLTETPQGLSRRRPGSDGAHPLATTLAHSIAALGGRLRRTINEGSDKTFSPEIDAVLYCPDYTVRSAGTAGLAPERIIDATRRDELPAIVCELLGMEMPSTDGASTADSMLSAEALVRVHRFFADLLQLTPEASAIVGEAEGLTTRLSGGLSLWARRLRFAPHRLRVVGTAGSGKTQLALAVIRDALAANRRPLYVCYNRPLADHLARTLPGEAKRLEIATFHQLSDRIARHNGFTPDFTRPDAFRQLEMLILELPAAALADWQFDELIVDEGQDFEPAWAEALFRLLSPGGRAWWLEDPMQNLYRRPPVSLPNPEDWVELRCDNNYRTPRAILSSLTAMLGEEAPAVASPILGRPPEILVYRDEAGLIEQTKRAISLGVAAGFKRHMIAVLSYRGRENSRLARYERLGPYSLKSFTGQYDLLGNPILRDGDVAFDSVMRFKGQSAPCVVLTEVQFDSLDESARRRIFVGATRATMALFIVAQEHSARHLREKTAGP